MKLLLLSFLLLVQLCFGQETVVVDNQFNSKFIKNELNYYIDTLETASLNSIQSKEFKPYTTNFPGQNSTRFWFRLAVESTAKEPINLVYKINTVSFENLTIYIKDKNSLEEIYSFKEKMKKNIEVPILLNKGEITAYYFQVDFTKSVYFPIEIVTKVENLEANTKRQLQLGLYYGFALMVLLINIFFYINTKDKFFLYYCFLLLSITFILAELDGLFYEFFGNTNLIRHVDITLHLSLIISLMLFTTNALKLQSYYPKLHNVGISIIIVNVFCFIIYVITDDILWYSIGEGFNALALIIYWASGFLLLKKEVYARYIVLGYSIIFISSYLYILPSEFGLVDIGFTDGHFKIGSVFEMIVFLYAISYRHKSVENDKKTLTVNLNKKIEEDKILNKPQEELLTLFIEKHKLTSRESEIVKLILQGTTNKEIADQLSIQLTTVKYHVSNLFAKLEIKKRTELSFVYATFKKDSIQ